MNRLKSKFKNALYIHLNEQSQCVITHGVNFSEFIKAVPKVPDNILLLKHNYMEADFNTHTMLSYVPQQRIKRLLKEDLFNYGNFCWIDFVETASLNELENQEIAELLYLGHLQKHLQLPFYNKLANEFVYLAQGDGWFNKTYYRNLDVFYYVLGKLIQSKLNKQNLGRRIFPFSKRRTFPAVSQHVMFQMEKLFKFGVVIVIDEAVLTRTGVEIPLWFVGDFINIDKMYDELTYKMRKRSEGKLIFNRKNKEWKISKA